MVMDFKAINFGRADAHTEGESNIGIDHQHLIPKTVFFYIRDFGKR